MDNLFSNKDNKKAQKATINEYDLNDILGFGSDNVFNNINYLKDNNNKETPSNNFEQKTNVNQNITFSDMLQIEPISNSIKQDITNNIRSSLPMAIGTTIQKSIINKIVPSNKSDLKYIIKNRLTKLTNEYIFNQNYTDNIISFFRKFNSIILAKIEYSLDFNRKFILFFKNISQCYFRFAKDLEKSNELINITNNQGMILNHSVNFMMEQAQNQITSYFENFSNTLTQKMVNGGISEGKIKEFYLRLNKISKDFDISLNKIIKYRASISKEYTSCQKIFDEFKACFNDNDSLNKFLIKYDFYQIEFKIGGSFKVMDVLIKDFLLIYKEKLLNMQVLLLDYVSLIKENMDIYISENKKIFNESSNLPVKDISNTPENKPNKKSTKDIKDLDCKEGKESKEVKGVKDSKEVKENKQVNNKHLDFNQMQKHFDNLNNESLEDIFSTEKIINYKEIDIDKDYLKTLNEILCEYHRNLLVGNYGNIGNLDIKDFEKFKLENHKTFRHFIEFMILVTPNIQINLKDYILSEFTVKRENGLILQKWQTSKIILTVQGYVLVYDEPNSLLDPSNEVKEHKLIEKFLFKSVKLVEKDSKKSPFSFTLVDKKKGILFNSKTVLDFDAENSENFDSLKKAFDDK